MRFFDQCVLGVFALLSLSSAQGFAQTEPRPLSPPQGFQAEDNPRNPILAYRDRLSQALEKALADGGTDDLAGVVRSYAQNDHQLTLNDFNRFFLETNGGNPFVISVRETREKIEQANLRMARAGLRAIRFTQAPEAELIERMRKLANTKGLSLGQVQDEVTYLSELSQRIYSEKSYAPSLERNSRVHKTIRVGVLRDELIAANRALNQYGRQIEYRFVGDPAVTEATQVALARSDKPRPGQEESYRRWMMLRKATPVIVMAQGLFTGYWAHFNQGKPPVEVTKSVTLGSTASALEWQFAHFSAEWNDKVWLRYGLRAGIAANVVYPVILQLVGVMTMIAFDDTSKVFSAHEWGVFANQVAVGALTFVTSVFAAQKAIAILKDKGVLDESERFKRETIIATVGNVGRLMSTVAMITGGDQKFATNWGIWEPWNMAHFNAGTWIGLGVQASVLTFYTAPVWFQILKGNDLYDGYTKYLAAMQGGESYEGGNELLYRTFRRCERALHGQRGR